VPSRRKADRNQYVGRYSGNNANTSLTMPIYLCNSSKIKPSSVPGRGGGEAKIWCDYKGGENHRHPDQGRAAVLPQLLSRSAQQGCWAGSWLSFAVVDTSRPQEIGPDLFFIFVLAQMHADVVLSCKRRFSRFQGPVGDICIHTVQYCRGKKVFLWLPA
jgi:hypothetical protein